MTQKFTTSCFIRKNTAELRKKLEELGYIQLENGVNEWHIPISKLSYLRTDYSDEIGNYFIGENGYWYDSDIDCGTNEDCFLAIAALRDDTDKGQWFIYDTMDCIFEDMRIIDWFKCDEDDIKDMMFYDSEFLNCHKATAEEIIEHFKN